MNKTEFITTIAEANTLTKKDAAIAVEAVLAGITNALANGDSVNFIGFGSFSTTDRAARTGVNPSTGESIQIAATTAPKFKAGASLKAAVK